jgi:hypothetical protein
MEIEEMLDIIEKYIIEMKDRDEMRCNEPNVNEIQEELERHLVKEQQYKMALADCENQIKVKLQPRIRQLEQENQHLKAIIADQRPPLMTRPYHLDQANAIVQQGNVKAFSDIRDRSLKNLEDMKRIMMHFAGGKEKEKPRQTKQPAMLAATSFGQFFVVLCDE